jgi:cellulose biosynthesis protein BcsQ
MTIPVVALFNNKGGVGKTSLAYHLAWMYSDLGLTILAADLDPQANLTAAFLDEDALEELWPDTEHIQTVFGALNPLFRGTGDILDPIDVKTIADHLYLLPGDLALTRFEDDLSQEWPGCMDARERSFRVISVFWRILQKAARISGAKVVLVDLGPNLGAINRAVMVATDYVVMPLAPDLFSLQGLKNIGPTLKKWRQEWEERRKKAPRGLEIPLGAMKPIGYIIMQHAVRRDRPVKAYARWMERIPHVYQEDVLEPASGSAQEHDPHQIGLLKHYRSLMPMAQEARKPIFHLTSADGAIGAHALLVKDAQKDFSRLAKEIAKRCRIPLPASP